MNVTVAFATPVDAPRWKRWLVYSPAARIAIFGALYLSVGSVLNIVVVGLGWSGRDASALAHGLLQLILRAGAPLIAYLLLLRFVERRSPRELALHRLAPDALAGVVLGLLLMSSIVGLLWLAGSYHVVGTQPHPPWLTALLSWALGAGIGEEIICRGVLFRILEEGLGTFPALFLSALYFGAMHLGNPDATVWSAAAIAVEGGVLFGLLYHLSRSLPLCMGVHAAWNFAQGTLYGIPVSGAAAAGWLVSARSGPDWLSGGAFGAEASVLALAVCALAAAGVFAFARRQDNLVAAAWRR